MPAWSDRQISRFNFRVALFTRRGIATISAETLADKLAFRDFDYDTRRVCLECESLQRSGRCFQAAQGKLRNTPAYFEPVQALLHRCDTFSFLKP